jgi:hypothetical protein
MHFTFDQIVEVGLVVVAVGIIGRAAQATLVASLVHLPVWRVPLAKRLAQAGEQFAAEWSARISRGRAASLKHLMNIKQLARDRVALDHFHECLLWRLGAENEGIG